MDSAPLYYYFCYFMAAGVGVPVRGASQPSPPALSTVAHSPRAAPERALADRFSRRLLEVAQRSSDGTLPSNPLWRFCLFGGRGERRVLTADADSVAVDVCHGS